MKQDLKIVFFGTPDFVIPVMDSIRENFNLIAVVTTSDAPVGRKQILTPSPVAQAAEKAGKLTLKPARYENPFTGSLMDLSPDLFVVASYGKIIPQPVLDIPRLGSINIHPSRLPEYRGPSPIQTQILDGVSNSGISYILMDSEIDHGPILHIANYQISPDDTFESLHYSMFEKSAAILPEIILKFSRGEIAPVPQSHQLATFCSQISRQDGYFDIENPPAPDLLNRMIRAFYPWPTAWTRWNGKIVKLLPGQMIQIEGKNPVKLKEFLNGYSDFPLK